MSDDDEYPTLNDSMGAVIKLVSELTRKRDALKARVAELEAEVERLRVIALPEITKEIAARWALPYPCLIGSNEDDEWEWTKDAAEFVALLNAGRTK